MLLYFFAAACEIIDIMLVPLWTWRFIPSGLRMIYICGNVADLQGTSVLLQQVKWHA
jgi:hypothetical protein